VFGKRSHHLAVIILQVVLSTSALMVPEAAFALGPPGPPSLFLMFEHTDQSVAAGCPTVNAVRLISQEGFEGEVTLIVINPPAGVNVTFTPNPVYVPSFYENTSLVTVRVMPNTPQERVNLTVIGLSVDKKTNDTKLLTINVLPPCEPANSEVKTTTETVTRTATVTLASTTEAVDDSHPQLYSPANSSALVWSRRLLNNSLLLKTSIDKLVYSPAGSMRLKGTLTNLTPQPLTVSLMQSIFVTNSEGNNLFWTYPEEFFLYVGMTMPSPDTTPFPTTIEIGPNQTVTLDKITRDWNMTGLHVYDDTVTPSRVIYDNHTVPEGQYIILFTIGVMRTNGVEASGHSRVQYVSDEIPFEVSKASNVTSASAATVTKQASDPSTYAWAIGATAAALVLAAALLLQRGHK
jgi:hypothetical protein